VGGPSSAALEAADIASAERFYRDALDAGAFTDLDGLAWGA